MRLIPSQACPQLPVFQSTHPVRGATVEHTEITYGGAISIHAPREGCDLPPVAGEYASYISIHAPREGCDFEVGLLKPVEYISIHAPREGCDTG